MEAPERFPSKVDDYVSCVADGEDLHLVSAVDAYNLGYCADVGLYVVAARSNRRVRARAHTCALKYRSMSQPCARRATAMCVLSLCGCVQPMTI